MSLSLWTAFGETWLDDDKVSFNGIARRIRVNDGVALLDIQADVYSAWVRWSERDSNGRYLPAMRFTGLDPIPGGQTGATFFLINNWKLEYDPNVVALSGILYSDDYATPYWSENDSPIYPATVSAISLSASGVQAVVDINAIAEAVAAKFAEPAITTAGIASAIGTVDVDSAEIADEVAGRFTFGADGRVAADITGSDSARDIRRAVTNAIPSPASASTIWDAAPKWLKKQPSKAKDYSDEIRTLSNKLDNLYSSIQIIQQQPTAEAASPVDVAGIQREIEKVSSAVAAIQIPDGEEGFTSLRSMSKQLQSQLDDVQIALLGVREDIRELPESMPEPDLSSLVTKTELSTLKDLVNKLENYDDANALAALNDLADIAKRISNQASVVDKKVDLVLDNQLQLTF